MMDERKETDLKESERKEKELNETEMEKVAGGKMPSALDMLKEY